MKLDYFDLLASEPMNIKKVGDIKSPTLREIRKVSYRIYQLFISILIMNPKSFFESINEIETYESMSEEQLHFLNIYDLLVSNESYCKVLEESLNFFMSDDISYNLDYGIFFTYNGATNNEGNKIPTGTVNRDNWNHVRDIILQRNCIKLKDEGIVESKNITSKRALSIMQKLQKGREKKPKNGSKNDKNTDIANIISSVANRHESLNILNIWDLTIYQLWDTFHRMQNNNIYDIQATSTSVWGDKEKQFDATMWFKNLNIET